MHITRDSFPARRTRGRPGEGPVSEAWYTRVFGVQPVLDEDTGPFRRIVYQLGGTLFGLHGEIKDAGYGSRLSVRDPDHIALELFVPPA